jgi:Zn-dependent peptidase ImmA (M78 family)
MSVAKTAAISVALKNSLAMKGMQAAVAARSKAGCDQKSPVCVYGICEVNKVTVRFNDISMEGMYDRTPLPRIHVSALRPVARRNFTCAHELGHHLFGHGSTIDELRMEDADEEKAPDEILADAFASFLLMPTLGIREAFTRRGLVPEKATPLELYAVACNFGVGQSTLVNHLAFSVGAISRKRRNVIGKTTPKAIRTALLGDDVSDHMTYVDELWNSSTLDAEQGALLFLPRRAVFDTDFLVPERQIQNGVLLRAVRPGISRVAIPGTDWATYVRIARRRYVGLAKYRHLEESDDE